MASPTFSTTSPTLPSHLPSQSSAAIATDPTTTFEDAIMRSLESLSPPSTGPSSPRPDASTDPILDAEIPLPLDDPRRTFPSQQQLQCVRLTEAKGSLMGGSIESQYRRMDTERGALPPPSSQPTDGNGNAAAPPRNPLSYLSRPLPLPSTIFPPSTTSTSAPSAIGVQPLPTRRPTRTQLARAVNAAADAQIAELRKRAHARREAMRHNERVGRELGALKAQRDMELRIESRMRAEAEKRRGGGGVAGGSVGRTGGMDGAADARDEVAGDASALAETEMKAEAVGLQARGKGGAQRADLELKPEVKSEEQVNTTTVATDAAASTQAQALAPAGEGAARPQKENKGDGEGKDDKTDLSAKASATDSASAPVPTAAPTAQQTSSGAMEVDVEDARTT